LLQGRKKPKTTKIIQQLNWNEMRKKNTCEKTFAAIRGNKGGKPP
jgi:hypothetical protein